jgi:hypothetical protein
MLNRACKRAAAASTATNLSKVYYRDQFDAKPYERAAAAATDAVNTPSLS